MTEGEFFIALKETLAAGFTARAIAGVKVQQGYQPRQQGAPSGMALLLWKINLRPFGYPKTEDKWVWTVPPPDPQPVGYEQHTETQIYEMTVQVTGSVKQPPPDPANPNNLLPYTAGDLCKLAGRILQSVAGCAQLRTAGIGVEKLLQMPQSYFKDDSDAFEQSPNFTLVFTFTDTDTTASPYVLETGLKVLPV